MKKSFIFLLALILIIALYTMRPTQQQVYRPSEGAQLVNSISAKTAKIIMHKYNLRPCGMGVAMPGGPIQEITLCFQTLLPFTKEQLRELVINSAHELLNQVKENEEIQQFIKTPPFTIKNIQIIIYNQDSEGREVYEPGIATAQIADGILTYRTVESSNTFKFKQQFEESYEKALDVLLNNQNKML